MKAKTIEKISPKSIWDIADEVSSDMQGCIEGAKAVTMIKLPDGRVGELQIVITTDEDDFIG